MVSVIVWVMIPLTPCVGYCLGKSTLRCLRGLVVGTLAQVCGTLCLSFVAVSPWFAVVVLGVSGSLVTSVAWGLVPRVVHKHEELGVAFSCIHGVENSLVLVVGVLVGMMKDVLGTYKEAVWMLGGVSALGFVAALLLLTRSVVADFRDGGAGRDTTGRREQEHLARPGRAFEVCRRYVKTRGELWFGQGTPGHLLPCCAQYVPCTCNILRYRCSFVRTV